MKETDDKKLNKPLAKWVCKYMTTENFLYDKEISRVPTHSHFYLRCYHRQLRHVSF